MTAIFPIIGVFTLGALLCYGEQRNDARAKWVFKPVTSALFLLAALSGAPDGAYDWALFVGLALCLLGDVLLISHDAGWFVAGLAAFLLGHVCYVVAFNGLVIVTSLNSLILSLIVLVSAGIFLWLRPHLGPMRNPVIAYIVVITLMLCSAWAVFFVTDMGVTFRVLVAVGATAFYISDITVARDRFMGAGFINRAVGLPLYYLGQFMLAFSVGAC